MALRSRSVVAIASWAWALLLPAVCQAGIILQTSEVPFPPHRSLPSGFTAFQLDVATDNGDLISEVDVALGGPFHQLWFDRTLGGLPTMTPVGPGFSGDSHLTPGPVRIFSSMPFEDNNVTASPLPDEGIFDYGIGSYLSGAWAIPETQQADTTPLAYVVLPDDKTDEFSYEISVETISGDSFNLSQGILPPRPDPLPEPPPTQYPGIEAKAELITTSFGFPENELAGFAGYQLSVNVSEDVKISAVDVSINGPLHQRWSDVDFDGMVDPSITGNPADGLGDSHTTPPSNALLLTREDLFTEDNNVADSPLADGQFDYGVGSSLRTVWGIPGNTQSNEAQLAYIVIPEEFDPNQLDVDIEFSVLSGVGECGCKTSVILKAEHFFPSKTAVPEPSSLGLSLLGMLCFGYPRIRAARC